MRSSTSYSTGPIARRTLRNDADAILAARIERDRIRRQRVKADRQFDVYMLRQAGHDGPAEALERFFMENE
jgi:hypothetical protein